jgi:hypothetical protein
MSEVNALHPIEKTLSSRRTWIKVVARAILFGAVSASAYLLVFLNEDTVTKYFTRGGVYAVAVIATAIAFSLIHGTFASYVLELLGIRPNQGKDGH